MSYFYSNIQTWLGRCSMFAAIFSSTAIAVEQAHDEDIRDSRGLIEIPVVVKFDWGFWLIVTSVALVIILLGLLWLRKKRQLKRKSPLSLALADLSALAASQETLPAEDFANRAAQTIRQFLAAQFGIAAPKQTTEEFFNDLTISNHSVLTQQRELLTKFLKSCDLAKFAGSSLNRSQRDEILQAARSLIEKTAGETKKQQL